MYNELKDLVGKPCWFNEGVFEVRKNSDAVIVSVDREHIVTKHIIFGHVSRIPLSAIHSVYRRDL